MQSLRLRFIIYEEPINENLSDAIRADEQTLIKYFQPAFNNPKRNSCELEICDDRDRTLLTNAK